MKREANSMPRNVIETRYIFESVLKRKRRGGSAIKIAFAAPPILASSLKVIKPWG
jgi:hypothetical protein